MLSFHNHRCTWKTTTAKVFLNLIMGFEVTPSGVKHFTKKDTNMEMASLKTTDYFLYECVKLSTYCILPSLKFHHAAQTTFTNNRCSHKKTQRKTESITSVSTSSSHSFSPSLRQWHHWLSLQSKENIIQHVTLYIKRTAGRKEKKTDHECLSVEINTFKRLWTGTNNGGTTNTSG